jgi:hypothetical protein
MAKYSIVKKGTSLSVYNIIVAKKKIHAGYWRRHKDPSKVFAAVEIKTETNRCFTLAHWYCTNTGN